MTAPKRYNGHHCWNCWNVALWIGNDEGLYRFAIECRDRTRTAGDAARAFLADLADLGITKTPDGAAYTFRAVRSMIASL